MKEKQAMWEDDHRKYELATASLTAEQVLEEVFMVALETLLPEPIVSAMNALQHELASQTEMKEYIKRQVRNKTEDAEDTRKPVETEDVGKGDN